MTVSIASEHDSTTAKATSAVHNIHYADSKEQDHSADNANKVEAEWSEADIKVLEGMGEKAPTVTTTPSEDGDESQEAVEDEEDQPVELTEEEKEQQRIEEEN